MGLALPLCILLAGAAWQFTRRFDLSLVLVAALAALSLTIWRDNWQLCWLNPCVWALSDDFSNFRIFRSCSDAAHLAGGWRGSDGVVSLHPAVREGAARLPGPERAAGPPAYHRPVASGLFRLCLCRPAPGGPQQPRPDGYGLLPGSLCGECGLHQPQRPGIPGHHRWDGLRHGGLPVPEHLRAGVDSGLRRQSGLYHLQRAGQRRRSALLCERLSGVQRGHAGGGPPVGPGDRTDYGLRWLSPGKPECVHHAGRHGDQL